MLERCMALYRDNLAHMSNWTHSKPPLPRHLSIPQPLHSSMHPSLLTSLLPSPIPPSLDPSIEEANTETQAASSTFLSPPHPSPTPKIVPLASLPFFPPHPSHAQPLGQQHKLVAHGLSMNSSLSQWRRNCYMNTMLAMAQIKI